MTYDEVLRFYGNQTKIGAALGLKQSAVSAWHGVVPPHYQFQIEIITNGLLRADDAIRVPGLKVTRKAPHARSGMRETVRHS